MRAAPLLSLRAITKSFPGVLANDRVDLDIYPGEVHALIGENGAGKSTLMKILYGFYRADSGEILHEGVPVRIESPQDAVEPRLSPSDQRRLMDLSQEIASLEARVDTETNSEAKSPRVRRLTSVSARAAVDAYYLQSWRRKVETVGNLNYPDEARRQQLRGNVILTVTLNKDGSVQRMDIIEGSGHKVLDDSVQRIVQLAVPLPPIPRTKEEIDELHITRTWIFGPGDVLDSR